MRMKMISNRFICIILSVVFVLVSSNSFAQLDSAKNEEIKRQIEALKAAQNQKNGSTEKGNTGSSNFKGEDKYPDEAGTMENGGCKKTPVPELPKRTKESIMRDITKYNDSIKAIYRKETKNTGTDNLIMKYENLYKNCQGKKSNRCADVMYSLAKFYYEKALDDYIKAREDYEKQMAIYEKSKKGAYEPVKPIPNYKKSLVFYKNCVKEYPDFVQADEGYYQIKKLENELNQINQKPDQ